MMKRIVMLALAIAAMASEGFARNPAMLMMARRKAAAKAAQVKQEAPKKEQTEQVAASDVDARIAARLAAAEVASQEEIAQNFEAPKKDKKVLKKENLGIWGKTKRIVKNHYGKIAAVTTAVILAGLYDQKGTHANLPLIGGIEAPKYTQALYSKLPSLPFTKKDDQVKDEEKEEGKE